MADSPRIHDFEVRTTGIDGLVVLSAFRVEEDRGQVRELFRTSRYGAVPGMPSAWAQVNLTATKRGGVRGLHGEAMTKLVSVAAGEAFGVYVDARPDSPTRGAVETVALAPGLQVLVPAGVLNGFQATSEGGCEYLYLFDQEWVPGMAGVAVTPLDAELAISWPIPIDPENREQISAKDLAAPSWAELRG